MPDREYYYLKGDETFGEIIEFLRENPSKEIIIVIPPEAKELAHPVHLDYLKKEAQQLKKKIFISTEDPQIAEIAKSAGLKVFLEEYEYQEPITLVSDIRRPPKKRIKKASVPEKKEAPKFRINKIFVSLVVLILLISLVSYLFVNFYLAKAEVILIPQKIIQEFGENIIVDSKIVKDDYENFILKGEFVDLKNNLTKIYPTTGTKGGGAKAEGIIYLKNLAKTTLILIPNTRFQTPDGKIFRSKKRVAIPPQQEIAIEVVAVEEGEKYNIDPLSEFTIPGLKGTYFENKYQAYSKAPMKGGKSGTTKVVSIEDIIRAKKDLEQKLKEAILTQLSLKYPTSSYYIFDEGIEYEVDVETPNVKPEEPMEKFAVSGSVQLKTIILPKNTLKNFLQYLAIKDLSNKDMKIQGLNIKVLKLTGLDLKTKRALIQVSGSLALIPLIDLDQIKKKLVSQTPENAEKELRKIAGLKEVKIFLWPFWLKHFPKNPNRIMVKIQEM